MRSWQGLLLSGALCALAFGQDTRPPGEGRGPRRGFGPGFGPPSPAQIVERLKETVQFDEQQLEQVSQIVAAHEQQMEDFRALRDQMRDAWRSGDQEAIAEIRGKFEERRGAEPILNMLKEIEPLLHEDQVAAFNEFRDNLPRTEDRGRGFDFMRMMRELPDVLEMSDTQRDEYQELLDAQREAFRERMRARIEEGGEGGPPDFEASREEFFKQIEGILNADQIAKLAQYRAEQEARGDRGPGRERGGPPDVRQLFAAAKRVSDLSQEQKDTLRDLEQEAGHAQRKLSRRDREGAALLSAETKQKIAAELNEAQQAEFEDHLRAADRRGPGRDFRRDRGRGGRDDDRDRGRDRRRDRDSDDDDQP